MAQRHPSDSRRALGLPGGPASRSRTRREPGSTKRAQPQWVAVTAGDPCGIGPEVILKALPKLSAAARRSLLLIGDRRVFESTARRTRRAFPNAVPFIDVRSSASFRPGHSSAAAGRASLAYVQRALSLWRAGRMRALVTGPVTKWAVQRVSPRFIGHTEYLARAMGSRDVVMLFVSDRLRVALVTRHVPLRRVPDAVTPRLLRTTLTITADALRRHFGVRRPRLALLGLNPHAGEAGSLGREELRLIPPTLRALSHRRVRCEGPFAADGFFAHPDGYDAVVCWYHDQGLIPFKMVARDQGCQLSAGLPIVRTAPDHGSALDIAGRGIAHPGSMRYAIELAERLTRRSC